MTELDDYENGKSYSETSKTNETHRWLDGARGRAGPVRDQVEIDAGSGFGSRCRSCGAAQRELKLVSPIAARSPGLRLELSHSLEFEIERHGSADEVLQGGLIDLLAFVDVDGAPDISVEAGVE
jgi:hypothetical protein